MALLSLDDAKGFLGVTTAGKDDTIQGFVDAVTRVIEGIIGPVDTATKTKTVNGGASMIVVGAAMASVMSVQVDGADQAYVADLTNGIIYGGTYNAPVIFTPGVQNVVITYTVGSDDPPAGNVAMAARELLRFWWQIGQQGTRRNAPPDAEMPDPAYAVPHRVIELLKPDLLPPNV